jgi:hypothetical protein
LHYKNELQINGNCGNLIQAFPLNGPWCFDLLANYSIANNFFLQFNTTNSFQKTDPISLDSYFAHYDARHTLIYANNGFGFGYFRWFGNIIAGSVVNFTYGTMKLEEKFRNYNAMSFS